MDTRLAVIWFDSRLNQDKTWRTPKIKFANLSQAQFRSWSPIDLKKANTILHRCMYNGSGGSCKFNLPSRVPHRRAWTLPRFPTPNGAALFWITANGQASRCPRARMTPSSAIWVKDDSHRFPPHLWKLHLTAYEYPSLRCDKWCCQSWIILSAAPIGHEPTSRVSNWEYQPKTQFNSSFLKKSAIDIIKSL